MTAIVMNTLSGAVTEYDWSFQSITPLHAADAGGYYLLGGDNDAGDDIAAITRTGCTLMKTPLVKTLESVYLGVRGGTTGVCVIEALDAGVFNYNFTIRDKGMSLATPGRGIRENYLGYGFKNVDGADFQLDQIEVVFFPAQQRKV